MCDVEASPSDSLLRRSIAYRTLASSQAAVAFAFETAMTPPEQECIQNLFLCTLEEGNDLVAGRQVRALDISAKAGLQIPRFDETPPEIIDTVLPASLLHHAVAAGRTEVIRAMLEASANVERLSKSVYGYDLSERGERTAARCTTAKDLVATLRALYRFESEHDDNGKGFAGIGWRRDEECHRGVVGGARVSTYGARKSSNLERPRERLLRRLVLKDRSGKLHAAKASRIGTIPDHDPQIVTAW
jgi:hypothetical protein